MVPHCIFFLPLQKMYTRKSPETNKQTKEFTLAVAKLVHYIITPYMVFDKLIALIWLPTLWSHHQGSLSVLSSNVTEYGKILYMYFQDEKACKSKGFS